MESPHEQRLEMRHESTITLHGYWRLLLPDFTKRLVSHGEQKHNIIDPLIAKNRSRYTKTRQQMNIFLDWFNSTRDVVQYLSDMTAKIDRDLRVHLSGVILIFRYERGSPPSSPQHCSSSCGGCANPSCLNACLQLLIFFARGTTQRYLQGSEII